MPSDLGTSRDELAGLREHLAHRSPILSSPRDFLRQHAETVDGLVRRAFLKAHGEGPLPSACLIAVGGYGRLELAPSSDVDLLLLYAPSHQEGLPGLIEKTLYPLWDLGLEVSCSSRSVEECLRLAQSDPSVRTGLMDSRYLDGDYDLFRRLHDLFGRKVLHRGVRDFARALMTEIHQRHQRFEDPAFVLEPEIKEGKGGLRDFQIGRWIIRSRYKTDRWESILFPDESRALDRSLQFLWAVRNELHLLSGRRQDTLTFELQEKIAPLLRFSPGTPGVEELMREYHLASQKILAFTMGFLDRVLSEPPPFRKLLLAFRRRTIDASFCLAEGELCLVDPVALRKDLSRLMRLFEHSQTYKAPMSFRVEEAAREVIPFIDDRFRGSPEISRIFLAILTKGEWADRILRKMHDLGFLSRYFPEFAEIEGRVHYDLYHVHPVDIHSLLTVEELVRLKTGGYEKEYPALTSMVREIGRPDLLLLAALLHDIGKAKEGHHSLTGEEMIRKIGLRMSLNGAEREVLAFLVRNHLVMLETAFRRDLHDEGTIARFGRLAGDIESLKMLYLLTFADIKAVGPEAWTSWKNALLAELFLKTSRFLERGRRLTHFEEEDEKLRKLKSLLGATASPEEIESLPARYLSAFPEVEILHHLELARSLKSHPLAVEWTLLEKGRARVTVCTRDRYGLFAMITGAMFLNRLSILEAQIHTWVNGVALDTFWVMEDPDEMERRLVQFQRDCEAVLDGTTTLKGLLAQRREASPIPRKVIPGVPAEVKINHGDSDFFTIIEITGKDRLGVLYDITQAFTDHGCDIHIAKISTLGNRIVDAFYVQNEWGDKIAEDESTDRLRKILLDRLTST